MPDDARQQPDRRKGERAMGDIPKQTCWSCKHFSMILPTQDWSEYTPGSDWSMWCQKGQWPGSPDDSEEMFGRCMEIGFTCPVYERKDFNAR